MIADTIHYLIGRDTQADRGRPTAERAAPNLAPSLAEEQRRHAEQMAGPRDSRALPIPLLRN